MGVRPATQQASARCDGPAHKFAAEAQRHASMSSQLPCAALMKIAQGCADRRRRHSAAVEPLPAPHASARVHDHVEEYITPDTEPLFSDRRGLPCARGFPASPLPVFGITQLPGY